MLLHISWWSGVDCISALSSWTETPHLLHLLARFCSSPGGVHPRLCWSSRARLGLGQIPHRHRGRNPMGSSRLGNAKFINSGACERFLRWAFALVDSPDPADSLGTFGYDLNAPLKPLSLLSCWTKVPAMYVHAQQHEHGGGFRPVVMSSMESVESTSDVIGALTTPSHGSMPAGLPICLGDDPLGPVSVLHLIHRGRQRLVRWPGGGLFPKMTP